MRLASILAGPYLVSEWVAIEPGREYGVLVRAGDVSPINGVTVQFKKATSSGGAGSTNHGSAVSADDRLVTSALAADLGVDGSGVQYTHVSATVTDQDSPNSYTALAVLTSLKDIG